QPEEVLTLGRLERLAGAAGALHALREAGERPGVVIEPGDDLVGAGTEDLRCLPDPLHVTRREADPLQSVVHGRHAPAPCPWAARSPGPLPVLVRSPPDGRPVRGAHSWPVRHGHCRDALDGPEEEGGVGERCEENWTRN